MFDSQAINIGALDEVKEMRERERESCIVKNVQSWWWMSHTINVKFIMAILYNSHGTCEKRESRATWSLIFVCFVF